MIKFKGTIYGFLFKKEELLQIFSPASKICIDVYIDGAQIFEEDNGIPFSEIFKIFHEDYFNIDVPTMRKLGITLGDFIDIDYCSDGILSFKKSQRTMFYKKINLAKEILKKYEHTNSSFYVKGKNTYCIINKTNKMCFGEAKFNRNNDYLFSQSVGKAISLLRALDKEIPQLLLY